MLAQHFSKHARKRIQQRGITDLEIELILMYGTETHHGDGCVYSRIDRDAFKRLERDIKRVHQKIDSLRKKFVIISETSAVVTTGHEYRHAIRK